MSKKAKKPVTKIYNVISENDGNDSFRVEANTPEEAASKALEVLGWGIEERFVTLKWRHSIGGMAAENAE